MEHESPEQPLPHCTLLFRGLMGRRLATAHIMNDAAKQMVSIA